MVMRRATAVDDRGVRAESVTNQFRLLVKQRKRKNPTLAPLSSPGRDQTSVRILELDRPNSSDGFAAPGSALPAKSPANLSLQRQIQGPLTLQWLVDDFVKSAGVGDVGKVDQYIRGGIPINMKHSVLQYTALHASAALEDDSVTKHLVQAGADVNLQTRESESVLHLAARFGKVPVAQEVLRHHADMRTINSLGMTPKEVAAEAMNPRMEEMLEPPPSPPTCLRISALSSTSATIVWNPLNGGVPLSSTSTTALAAYLFRLTWQLCGSAGQFTAECTCPVFQIRNLMPASDYNVAVQAGNHIVGWSAPSSPPLLVRTENDVPNAMSAPDVTQVSDTFIRMRFRLPQCNGGHIERVSIQIQCTGSIASVSTSTFHKLLKPVDHAEAWETVLINSRFLRPCDDDEEGLHEYTTTGLAPGHVYYFRIQACNQNGWSPDGEVSDGICTNDCPKVVTKKPRSMMLVWAKPYSTENIDAYELQVRLSSTTRWEVAATGITKQSWIVDDLIPATMYSFRVVPRYSRSGWENPQACACSPLVSTEPAPPEPPVDFKVLDRTAHTVTLTWGIPRYNGFVVTSYCLEYRRNDNNAPDTPWIVSDAEVPVDFKYYVANRLQRGHPYQFRVSARNALGDGEYLVVPDIVWTYLYLPPLAPMCLQKTSFALHIAWELQFVDDADENDSAARIVVYELQMRRVEHAHEFVDDGNDSAWTIVADNLTATDVVVPGLSSLAWYRFRVRARTTDPTTAAPPVTPDLDVDAGDDSEAAEADPAITFGPEASSVFSAISDAFQTLRRM